jgi:hypothetical protein
MQAVGTVSTTTSHSIYTAGAAEAAPSNKGYGCMMLSETQTVREPPSQCTLWTVSTTTCSKLFVRPSLQQAVQHCVNDSDRRFKYTAALVPQ